MFLKCIEIQGFKSFADKINLHFEKGITSVVGPNGSGKSNISDAVRWVLGEQSAKSLRGNRMEDVIFAGTQHRKPVGFAYVSLTLDNSDRAIPLDYSDITISRRVYRSGESEYYINKTLCRMRDIHELFMNTGIGKEGYSIIGQGRIDEILSTRSEDRRAIFEEAAGIMKYKARKKEALHKLENTKQNLLRIDDIIIELESQLEPLKDQAEKARKYLALSGELKELEVSLYIDSIEKNQAKIKDMEDLFTKIRQDIQNENDRIEKKKQENRERAERLEKLKNDLEVIRNELFEIDRETGRYENRIQINVEKIKSLESGNIAADQDIEGTKSRIEAINRDIEKRNKRLENLEREHENYSNLLAQAEKKLGEIIARLNEKEREIELMKQEVMDKLDDLSESRTRLNSLKNEKKALKERQRKVSDEIRKIMLERDQETLRLEEAMNDLRKAKGLLSKQKEDLNEKEQIFEQGKTEIEHIREEQNKLLQELQSAKSRRKVLTDMENSLEGYQHSVRAILKACSENGDFGGGVYGALAQLISVKEHYETAIEVSLGTALQNIVVRDELTAKALIEFLKAKNIGRATFLPVSAVKPRILDQNIINQLKQEKGFLGLASDMIQCRKTFRDIILNLLGRTVVVNDIDDGIAISRKYGYSFRVVTLDGEILNPGGSITGGSRPSKTSSLLSRSRLIRELEKRVEALSRRSKQLEADCAEKASQLVEMEENISRLRKNYQDQELIVLKQEQFVSSIKESIGNMAARQDMLKVEYNELEKNIKSLEEDIKEEEKRLSSIEESIELLRKTIEENQLKNKEEQASRDAVHMDINDYKVSVNSIIESINYTKETIERLDEEKKLLAENIQKRLEAQVKNNERIEALKSEIVGIKQKIQGYQEMKTGKSLKFEALQDEVAVLEEDVSQMVDTLSSHNETIRALQEEFGKLEVRQTKFQTELEAIQNRLWDEYELTYQTAGEYRKEIQSVRKTQERINELKAAIRELGPVNVSAIDDYSKTMERYRFLTAQKDDLIKSEENLNRVIQEMTSIMKKQFVEEFQKINYNFNVVFRELFDGGRAEVVLENPDDVLESEIEIIAQPPGKKLQNMLLLSGGERALTAIALLFAILKMRPVPFCILDEIESALDDANVYKFAEYIRKFTDNTQFIVITHRKGTMEYSDALYGVTMQEYGVSSVVSLKLDDMKKAVTG
ncbi:MAG TPA: chromosome segregation protein SMC [Ruminiclostridium sp.]|nr:chromosome segregation protein SMC [Clostridiaceae bacterium]HAA26316.1 chromosome segregation protein SMC [Ruminiclostridium sp.]